VLKWEFDAVSIDVESHFGVRKYSRGEVERNEFRLRLCPRERVDRWSKGGW
jgi:hypothetical protein